MNILGISCYYHDAAACLLVNGELIAAAEEERFTRRKHDPSFPKEAIRFCLQTAALRPSDIDYVVFHEKPFLKFERILKTILATYPRSRSLFEEVVIGWMSKKLWIKSQIQGAFDQLDPKNILFCSHHLAHAASALFCSPFPEAALLTCDGVGEWTTTATGFGKSNNISITREIRFPHSLGLLYSAFTSFLGFEVNDGEYKVMGMAAFGKPKYTDRIHELIRVADNGSFRLNMKYFSFPYSPSRSFNRHFERLFGKPRDGGRRFVTTQTSLYDDPCAPNEEELNNNQYYADIAASIQNVTEEILLKICRQLYQETKSKNLCLAGGVALNCSANGRILRETPFERVFIQPAAGDSGAALGAALFVHHCLLQNPRQFVFKHAYWGKHFSRQDITPLLGDNRINAKTFDKEEELLETVCNALLEQKIVGWFQGRAEWGPRALGNRSILADPRKPQTKDIVNIKIKFREPFRPFAPSVLADQAENFFNLGKEKNQSPLEFMLATVDVKCPDLIPAVTHIDNTSRVQLVDEGTNPRFYRLIKKFGEKTNVPVLLNTSFNLKGEPIVNSPEDALNTFLKCDLDLLVIENTLITKK
ncbi:MAG: carbamoyltransferase [Candidatus Omnitrophota bacterium]